MNSKRDEMSRLLDQDLSNSSPERGRRKVSEVLARMSGPRAAEIDSPAKTDTPTNLASPTNTDSQSIIDRSLKSAGPSDSSSQAKIDGLTNINSPSDIDGLSESDSGSKTDGLSESGGPAKNDGLSVSDRVAPQNDRPSKSDGPFDLRRADAGGSPAKIAALSYARRPEFSLLNTLSEAPAHMPLFHQMTDYLDRQMTPSEQAVYRQLFRLTWGFQSSSIVISNGKLAERSNVGEATVRTVLKALEAKGLVRKVRMIFGSDQEQGNEWEVFAPLPLVMYLEERERKRRGSKS